jgi:Mg-chelatase subunit ChlD
MSFVVWAALAIAGLVVGPIVAHLLRRGRAREREFPAAALVPPLTSTARQRSRLEDWPLLVVRSALIVGLAVLGATPLVRCDRLSLARDAGASVAMAIVLDDSLSMRANVGNKGSRWELAVSGAEDLLRSARDGDAVAIVLAGRPARIALSPTTELSAARRSLADLVPSDRATDLASAVQLARAAVRGLPQKDHRVIVLSDLAGDPIPQGSPPAVAPLPALAEKVDDCAVASAERRGKRAEVTVACSSEAAAEGRRLELVAAESSGATSEDADAGRHTVEKGEVLARADVGPRAGEQTITVDLPARSATVDARLTGSDASSHDDAAPVSEEQSTPLVGVVADSTTASAKTGGPTVIEQALSALSEGWVVRPLAFVPDEDKGLEGFGAIVVDDPHGFSPEARAALGRFLEHGGVALALLGPGGASTQLGWTLEPFARGAARWEETKDLGIDPASVSWLGPESASLEKLARRGRVRLDGMELDGARVVGRWTDGTPWIVERRVGRGLAIAVGLPASLEQSDLALRPAFLALLDHVLRQADFRSGSHRTVAGSPWTFPEAKSVVIDGPAGRVPTFTDASDDACSKDGSGCERAVPTLLGRYAVHLGNEVQHRVVTLDPAEVLAEPRPAASSAAATTTGKAPMTNASRELSLVLLGLFAAELGIRLVRRWMARVRQPTPG